jgi:prepilin-type N-terminal cleavage/methylation domain
MNSPFSRRRPAAFTLVELLTVIAVIGILAAIVISTLGRVRRNAQQARSIANLRQIGAAMLAFAGDNKGMVPVWHDYTQTTPDLPGLPVMSGRYWWEALQTYLGTDPEIFHSPAHAEFDGSSRTRLRETLSYGWNYAVMGRHVGDNSKDGDHTLRIQDFPTPSLALAASDGRAVDSWGFIAHDAPPDGNRYGGRVPAVFADGHTAVLAASEFANEDPWFSKVKALPNNK